MPDLDQAPKYPIPKPIRRSYEIMPGWSMHEIRTAAKGVAVAVPLAIAKAARELLNEVYDVYGPFSLWKLRNSMAYEDGPWKHTVPGQEISHTELERFFRTRIAIASKKSSGATDRF